jgi:drug/metabolite transporter (DMT)-like permease
MINDLIRYIFFGQSLYLALLVALKIWLAFTVDRDTPERRIGIIALSASYLLALGYVFVTVAQKLGDPLSWRSLIGLAIVSLGIWGYATLDSSLLLRTKKGFKWLLGRKK